jgi:hypothetical protein
VLAAVKPIEVALRDFSSRVANVESRANASDQMSAGLQSSLRAQEITSKQLARTVETMNSRLEIFQQDLTAVSGQLSTLRQMVEAMTARNDKHDEKQSTIEVSLGAVQGQMADQNLGQTELTKLSSKTDSMVGSVTGLESSAQQADRHLSALQCYFASKPPKPEETLTGTPIGVDSTPTEKEDTSEHGKTRLDSEARSRGIEEGVIDSPSSSNPDGGLDHNEHDGTDVEDPGGVDL